MADEKHESKRNRHPRQKWLLPLLPSFCWSFWQPVSASGTSRFVSQTIYQESTSHLEEVLYKPIVC